MNRSAGRREAARDGALADEEFGFFGQASELYKEVVSRNSFVAPGWLLVGILLLGIFGIGAGLGLYLNSIDEVMGAVLVALGLSSIVGLLGVFHGPNTFDEYVDQIRDRVDHEAASQVDGRQGVDGQDPAMVRASESLEKQEAILREIYTQGLAQARASFRISIIFASIGATFLLLGIGLAIVFARSGGDKYVSIVAGAAGVVINLTSGVFFVQSNRARTSMAKQGAMLREESQDDRRLNAAREISSTIESKALRDKVRAKLALSLLRVENSPNEEQAGGEGEPQGDLSK